MTTRPTFPGGGLTGDGFVKKVIEARAYIATPEGQADHQFKANYTKWFREASGSRATRSLHQIDQDRGTSYAEKYGAHPGYRSGSYGISLDAT